MIEPDQKRTLILGIGNILLSDEGAGIRALECFQSGNSDLPDVVFLDGGTLSFTLAADIENATHLIVFDAAQFHEQSGAVHCLEGAEMDDFLAKGGRSVHEVGLMDLMDIARLSERLPEHRALIGIQPSKITWGETLSPQVAESVPVASTMASELLHSWHPEYFLNNT